jgi:hypothetical protein
MTTFKKLINYIKQIYKDYEIEMRYFYNPYQDHIGI